jgi:hypothetical protein
MEEVTLDQGGERAQDWANFLAKDPSHALFETYALSRELHMTSSGLSWLALFEMLAFAGAIFALAMATLYGVFFLRSYFFVSEYERARQHFWGHELEMSKYQSRFVHFLHRLFVEFRRVIVFIFSFAVWGAIIFGLLSHNHWVPDDIQQYLTNKLQ